MVMLPAEALLMVEVEERDRREALKVDVAALAQKIVELTARNAELEARLRPFARTHRALERLGTPMVESGPYGDVSTPMDFARAAELVKD